MAAGTPQILIGNQPTAHLFGIPFATVVIATPLVVACMLEVVATLRRRAGR
jgi:hypothetical protein